MFRFIWCGISSPRKLSFLVLFLGEVVITRNALNFAQQRFILRRIVDHIFYIVTRHCLVTRFLGLHASTIKVQPHRSTHPNLSFAALGQSAIGLCCGQLLSFLCRSAKYLVDRQSTRFTVKISFFCQIFSYQYVYSKFMLNILKAMVYCMACRSTRC